MSSTNTYKPTWLYIKRHKITGLKYFGKTTLSNPFKYKGSGTSWRNHISQHGNKIETLWVQKFDSKDDLVEFATFFSEFHNITESNEWANLMPENGKGGRAQGSKLTEEHKARIRKSSVGKIVPPSVLIEIRKTLMLKRLKTSYNRFMKIKNECIETGYTEEYISTLTQPKNSSSELVSSAFHFIAVKIISILAKKVLLNCSS
jgi:hypothetical protein